MASQGERARHRPIHNELLVLLALYLIEILLNKECVYYRKISASKRPDDEKA